MLKLDVTADVAKATEYLSDLARQHVPNAAARALTGCDRGAVKGILIAMLGVLARYCGYERCSKNAKPYGVARDQKIDR